jgi:hypothetical protein
MLHVVANRTSAQTIQYIREKAGTAHIVKEAWLAVSVAKQTLQSAADYTVAAPVAPQPPPPGAPAPPAPSEPETLEAVGMALTLPNKTI